MGLFNTAKNASLHYDTRDYGIDLGWRTDDLLKRVGAIFPNTQWPITTKCGAGADVDVRWNVEPVTLMGDTGSTVGGTVMPITSMHTIDGSNNCLYVGMIGGLRRGVWRVDVIVNFALRSSCTVTIGHYVNYVSVLNGVKSCAIETVH